MIPLAKRVLDGQQRAAARLLRLIDDGHPEGIACLKELFAHTGNARIIGLTGAPGSGKSTLTDQLVTAFRQQDKKVGVLAIDPTSPFTGGAILGDRIRMQRHETDPGVFIRSLATRGALGGLTRSTSYSIRVLDAYGCDVIIVETVGVGQDEVDIIREADTSLVVVVPGMGDDIQAIKAGILEIADIFVLNKTDREGADRTEKELSLMLELNMYDDNQWKPPITRTVARDGEGIDALMTLIQKHHEEVGRTLGNTERLRRETELHMRELLEQAITATLQDTNNHPLLEEVGSGTLDPYTAAERLYQQITR